MSPASLTVSPPATGPCTTRTSGRISRSSAPRAGPGLARGASGRCTAVSRSSEGWWRHRQQPEPPASSPLLPPSRRGAGAELGCARRGPGAVRLRPASHSQGQSLEHWPHLVHPWRHSAALGGTGCGSHRRTASTTVSPWVGPVPSQGRAEEQGAAGQTLETTGREWFWWDNPCVTYSTSSLFFFFNSWRLYDLTASLIHSTAILARVLSSQGLPPPLI